MADVPNVLKNTHAPDDTTAEEEAGSQHAEYMLVQATSEVELTARHGKLRCRYKK